MLDACKRRDLSWPLTVLGANGVTRVQISGLTGIPQGRLSEYKTRKHDPELSTVEAFADGMRLPPAARLAFGLALEPAARLLGGGTPRLEHPAGGHALMVVPKLAPTPSRFPRRIGLPGRKPLA